MRPIQVQQPDHDLTLTAGLVLVGHFLKTLAPALAATDAALPVRTGRATSDIVRSYLGLLVRGKSDFDATEIRVLGGTGSKAKTSRLRVYLHDDRPHRGSNGDLSDLPSACDCDGRDQPFVLDRSTHADGRQLPVVQLPSSRSGQP